MATDFNNTRQQKPGIELAGGDDTGRKKLHFVIVGGSLGGLAAGIALKALGHDTTILERNAAPVLQDQGAGIVAGGDTLAFLERYNCDRVFSNSNNRISNNTSKSQRVSKLAVPSHARQYLDREGKVVHTIDAEQYMTSWDLMYHLLRANYDGLRSSYFPDIDEEDESNSNNGNESGSGGGSGKAVHLHFHNRTVVGLEQEQPQQPQQQQNENENDQDSSITSDENRNQNQKSWKPKGGRVRVYWESSSGSDKSEKEKEKEKGSILADVVIGADGPSSTVRRIVQSGPDAKVEVEVKVERTYAGYCALRGTVPESEASEGTRGTFCERFTFFHCPGEQILAYLIPGKNGTVEPGHRLINFVWYTNFPSGSADLEEIMTDAGGRRRTITVPPGFMSLSAWTKQQSRAMELLPPQFSEIVRKTGRPFAQAVTDVLSPEHEYWGGRVVLVGDALAGFRPHTVASTSQAAFDAMLFADYVEGRVGRAEWKTQTLGFARFVQRRGVEMGEHSQHMDLPLEVHIRDRDVASTPRQDEVYPEWATAF